VNARTYNWLQDDSKLCMQCDAGEDGSVGYLMLEWEMLRKKKNDKWSMKIFSYLIWKDCQGVAGANVGLEWRSNATDNSGSEKFTGVYVTLERMQKVMSEEGMDSCCWVTVRCRLTDCCILSKSPSLPASGQLPRSSMLLLALRRHWSSVILELQIAGGAAILFPEPGRGCA
jgi:hypothetical protein